MSYAGASGTHDDSVMNFVLFAWFVSTDFFNALTDIEIKNLLYKEKLMEMEEDLPPFGFTSNEPQALPKEYNDLITNLNTWKSL